MGYALPITVKMTDMECGQCGIAFAMPETVRAERQRDGGRWYCPNGHPRVYRETDVDKVTRLLREEEARHKRTLARENEAITAKNKAEAELKRHQKRTKAGVCPCCNRSFVKLAAHMKTKHPDYAK